MLVEMKFLLPVKRFTRWDEILNEGKKLGNKCMYVFSVEDI
jgi:hypothetical protein